MFWESVEDLKTKKYKAQEELTSCRSRMSTILEQYERLSAAYEAVSQHESEYYERHQNFLCLSEDIEMDRWQGNTRIGYNYDEENAYRYSIQSLITDLCMDMEEIQNRLLELRNESEELSSTISRLNSRIDSYTRQINRRT